MSDYIIILCFSSAHIYVYHGPLACYVCLSVGGDVIQLIEHWHKTTILAHSFTGRQFQSREVAELSRLMGSICASNEFSNQIRRVAHEKTHMPTTKSQLKFCKWLIWWQNHLHKFSLCYSERHKYLMMHMSWDGYKYSSIIHVDVNIWVAFHYLHTSARVNFGYNSVSQIALHSCCRQENWFRERNKMMTTCSDRYGAKLWYHRNTSLLAMLAGALVAHAVVLILE